MERTGPASTSPARRGAALHHVLAVVALAAGVTAAGVTAGPGVGPAAAARHGSTRPRPARAGTATVLGQPAPAGSGALDAVSCGSAGQCWAVGSAPAGLTGAVVDATTDGGTTWQSEKIATAGTTELADVACPDRRHCMAVGTTQSGSTSQGAVFVTADSGRRWQAVESPVGAAGLAAVQCSAAGHCLVLAREGPGYWSASTTDGGDAWQRGGTLPAGFAGPSAVTCDGGGVCMAAGYVPTTPAKGAGAVAVSDDGGGTWTAATMPAGTGPLHDVACPAAPDCIAVGTRSTTLTDVVEGQDQMLASTDGGDDWTTATAPAGLGDAFGIACPSATSCIVVGTAWTSGTSPSPVGAAATTVDGGTTWRTAAARYVPVGLTGVACSTAGSCLAAGGDVLARVALPAAAPARAAPAAATPRHAR